MSTVIVTTKLQRLWTKQGLRGYLQVVSAHKGFGYDDITENSHGNGSVWRLWDTEKV